MTKVAIPSSLLERIKKMFLETVFDRQYIKDAILKNYIPVETLLDKNINFVITLGQRINILIDMGKYDLITDEMLEEVNSEECIAVLKSVMKKKDEIPCDLKTKVLKKFIKELSERIDVNGYLREIREYLYDDNELRNIVVDFLVQLNTHMFAKIDKSDLPIDLMDEVYSRRKTRFANEKKQNVNKTPKVRYKNLFYKAIIENNYKDYYNCRITPENLTEEEFNELLPYWLKCEPRLLSLLLRTQYFNNLPEDLRNNIVVTCANSDVTDLDGLLNDHNVKYNVVYVLENVKNVNDKLKVLNSFLRQCCLRKINGDETEIKPIPELENILTTLLLVEPSTVYYYYAYNIIFKPNFVDEQFLDEQTKYFLDFVLNETIVGYAPKKIKLYKTMLELYAKMVPMKSYTEILNQVKNILPLLS